MHWQPQATKPHRRRRGLLALALLAVLFLPYRPEATPDARAAEAVAELTIGASTQGRPITAMRIGRGSRKLVLVGDTHGGPEANTYRLALQLVEYYRLRPDLVPPTVRLYIIPTLNPDGLAIGTRFNANGVDLNRNMDTGLDACGENDWTPRVQGAYGVVSDTGGPYAMSEVESRIIRSFLLDAAGAIFLHSNAGLVFPALCDHAPSIAVAQAFASASGYSYSRYWPLYQITGGMHDWAASLGIAAITPELVTGDQSEFEQNLAGVQAVLDGAESLLPLPEERAEEAIMVPALIWRFWYMYGGTARFGRPLAPPAVAGDVVEQYFERALIEWRPAAADTPDVVRAGLLGRTLATGRPLPPIQDGSGRFFPETGYSVGGAFLDYWERGGVELFGYPISGEVQELGPDGQRHVAQYFERVRLDLVGERVELAPLGWQAVHRAAVQQPQALFQPR